MTDNNNNNNNNKAAAVVCIDMLDSSSEEELELNNPSHVSKKPAAKSKKRDETADASALSAVVKPAPKNNNSDDSDSDLSAGPTFSTVHPPKLTKQQQREADKIAKKQQRQLAKQQQKELQTEQKRRRVLQAQQQLGKFAPHEIVVLVHDELYQLLVGDVMDSLSPLYKIHPSLLLPATNAIQFIRQDYVLGGADVALLSYQQCEDSQQQTHELMNILVLLFHDASLFLELLKRDDENDDDDYPKLGEYVERFLKDHHRITLILYKIRDEIARQWNQHKTTTTSKPPPSDAQFHDSMVWLMVQYNVECIVCDSQESLVTTLSKLTRALSEQKYQQPVTELECVKKLKSDPNMTTTNKAQDTWIRQLQQVPGVGEQKARHLALYVPTMRSLYELYQNEPDEQKRRMLLSPLFHQGRNYPKLSETLYQLLTSENPKQLL